MQLDTYQHPLKATVVDPTHVKLSSPLPLGKGHVVNLAFLKTESEKDEYRQWQESSLAALANAYGANEPDYRSAK